MVRLAHFHVSCSRALGLHAVAHRCIATAVAQAKATQYVGIYAAPPGFCAELNCGGGKHILGRWPTGADAAVARDRAILHFELDRPLQLPKRSRKLGPASPEQLRHEAVALRKKNAGTKSRYVGVFPYNDGWQAYMAIDRERQGTLMYPTERDAAVAYDRMVLFYRSADAPRNFPEEWFEPASLGGLNWELQALRRTEGRFQRVRRLPARGLRIKIRPQTPREQKVALRAVGVYPAVNGRWVARIKNPEGRSIPLGTWDTERKAALAHDRAALHYYGPEYLGINDLKAARKAGPADGNTLVAMAYASFKARAASRFRGVYFLKSHWHAQIKSYGKRHYLGAFNVEEDAARAYDAAALRYRGRLARVNFHPETGKELRGLMRLCDVDFECTGQPSLVERKQVHTATTGKMQRQKRA